MLDKLTLQDFEACLNERFEIVVDNGEGLTLELVEASALEDGYGSPRLAPFSLVFRGPRGVSLPQQIYTLRHEQMESMDIFLVPIRPDERGMRLQAIFN